MDINSTDVAWHQQIRVEGKRALWIPCGRAAIQVRKLTFDARTNGIPHHFLGGGP